MKWEDDVKQDLKCYEDLLLEKEGVETWLSRPKLIKSCSTDSRRRRKKEDKKLLIILLYILTIIIKEKYLPG
jgi:hypothetical protein